MNDEKRFYRSGTLPIPDKTFTVETLDKERFVKLGEVTVTGKEVGDEMDEHKSIKGYEHCNIAHKKAATLFPDADPLVLTEQESANNATITKALRELTQKFLVDHNLKTPYDINCGCCEEWANEALRIFPQAEDAGTPEEYWDNQGWAIGHVWIVLNGLCYDSETLDGVKDWKDLTPFKNARKRWASAKTGSKTC